MANKQQILLLGDSNIGRYLGRLGLQTTNQVTYVQTRSMEEVERGLEQVKGTYKIIIFAFITNLIIAAGEAAANAVDRIPPIEEMLVTLVQKLR